MNASFSGVSRLERTAIGGELRGFRAEDAMKDLLHEQRSVVI